MKQERLSSEVFYWDAPSRALHRRDLFPLQVEIEGKRYIIPKWSLQHFKIVDFPDLPRLYADKKSFKIKPIIRFRNFNIQFETTAIPLHYDPLKRELIGRFEKIPEEHRELLQYFSEALETGDMVNIDNVLRRVDMPVTPASTELKGAEPDKAFRRKRAMMTAVYLLFGTALILYSLLALYKKFTRIEVDSAFVSAPIIQLKAPASGYINEVFMESGNYIAQGQPLLILDSAKTILSSDSNIALKRNKVALIESLISEKKYKLEQQLLIRQTKLKAAQRGLSAALSNRNIKCQRRYQTQTDRQNPQKHRAECQSAKTKVSSAQNKLAAEKQALKLANRQGSHSSAAMQVLINKLENAKLELYALGVESQKLHETGNKPNKINQLQTLLSSASGKLVNVIEDQHQYVREGQVIAIIQQQNTAKKIDAYVTQEKAAQLKTGQRALAYSPTLDDDVEAVIERIDYVENSLSIPNRDLFHWPVEKEKNVKLSLKIIQDTADNLPFGLPLSLSIQKVRFLDNERSAVNGTIVQHTKQPGVKGVQTDKPVNKQSKPAIKESQLRPVGKDSSSHLDEVLFNSVYADDISMGQIATYCKSKTRLFPASFLDNLTLRAKDSSLKGVAWKKTLLKKAAKLLDKAPHPLKNLHSSGVTDASNKALLETRKALQDANHSAILAIAFGLAKNPQYLQKARQLLLAWVKTYQPNGHPIDESRLEGFLWSYDLLRCYFTWEQQKTINAWLKTMQQKKHDWKFGPSSSKNNLRTHQLKMLLMLDNLLDDATSLLDDQETLAQHAKNNLLKDGKTLDYIERDALHYHVYDLEPWLEIALLEPEYKTQVNKAYDFLMRQLEVGNIHQQFKHSKQKIDEKRAKGGFDYAKKGGTFQVDEITRSVIVHGTLNQQDLAKDTASQFLSKAKIRQNIFFLARHNVWKN